MDLSRSEALSERVVSHLERSGTAFREALQELIEETGLPVTQSPYPQTPFLYFDPALASGQEQRRDRFYATLVEHGVFAHPRHHGFLCWQHTGEDLERALDAYRIAAKGS